MMTIFVVYYYSCTNQYENIVRCLLVFVSPAAVFELVWVRFIIIFSTFASLIATLVQLEYSQILLATAFILFVITEKVILYKHSFKSRILFIVLIDFSDDSRQWILYMHGIFIGYWCKYIISLAIFIESNDLVM